MRIILFFLVFTIFEFAWAGAGVTYHGRLVKPSGDSVNSPVVQFRIRVKSTGAEDCLLFEEQQTKDLSETNGIFSLSLGDNSLNRLDSTGLSFDRIFSNQGTFNLPGHCHIGNSYTPGYADSRKLEVSFNDGTFAGWENMPSQSVNYVPTSLNSLQVGGFRAEHLLRVEDAGIPHTISAMSSTQFTELMNLITGASTQYSKAGQLNGTALPSLSSGQALGWNGSAWSAVTPLTSASLPTCATGEVLKSNGSVLTCVTDNAGSAPADATTSTKGIVQISATGGIDINAGVISLSDEGTAGTYFKVTTDAKGRVTSGAVALLEGDIPNISTAGKVSGTALNAGTIGGSTAVNTTGNITTTGTITGNLFSTTSLSTQGLRLYEPTNTYRVLVSAPTGLAGNYPLVLPLTAGGSGQVLSTDGSGNLSWISPSTGSVTSVTGAAPIVVTGTATPVVSITQATTSTNGYLSSTDWNVFNGKQSTTLPSGQVWVGNGSNVSAARSLNIIDIKSTGTGNWLGASGACAAGLSLSYNSATDKLECATYALTNSQVTTALGFTPANGTNYVAKAGDTMTGALALPSNGLAVGTSELVVSSGRVGVGTTTPAFQLDVNGQSAFRSNAGPIAGIYGTGVYDRLFGGWQWDLINTRDALVTYGATDLAFNAGGISTTRMLIRGDSGKVGIGTTTPATTLEVAGGLRIADEPAGCAAAYAGTFRYNSGAMQFCNGSLWQSLGISGAGLTSLNGQGGSTQTFAMGATGTTPAFSSGSNVHTLNIPLASGAGVTSGTISKTDYDSFAGKLGTGLNNGLVWIGNGANVATARSLNIADIKSTGTGNWLGTSGSCVSGQHLAFNSVTDKLECAAFALTSAQVTAALSYAPVNKTGDTMTGTLSLPSNGLTVGTNQLVVSGGNVGVGTVSPTSTLQVAGSIATSLTSQTSNYTLTVNDSIVLASAASGALNMVLPSAVGAVGRQYTVKKTDASSNTVNVMASASQTIDGDASFSLTNRWQFVSVVSDGSGWLITGTNATQNALAFAFTDVSNALNSTLVTSSTVTISGSGTAVLAVSGSGSPQISINGGAWATSGSAAPGQTIAVRLTSSATASTASTVVISGASANVNWTVTTAASLYAFSTHTFTNCGSNGVSGPSLAACQSAYSAMPWAANTSYLNMTTNGIQEWTVPATATYRITVAGASGGNAAGYVGGRGTILRGDVALTQGQKIKILVGQKGGTIGTNCDAGSGGGSFVTTSSNVPLVIAGGGSGASYNINGLDAVFSNNATSACTTGGTGGMGASGASSGSSGGGGLLSNGQAGNYGNAGGLAFVNGGTGGPSASDPAPIGGFGGGSGGHGNCYIGSGGGGGYSGGGAGGYCGNGVGGGGGSYNDGSNQLNSTYNSSNSHGYVTIMKL